MGRENASVQDRGRRRRSIAPMWHRSLCLRRGITGATGLKQHLTHASKAWGHLHPKGPRGQEHDVRTADEIRAPRIRGQPARSCLVKTALFESKSWWISASPQETVLGLDPEKWRM